MKPLLDVMLPQALAFMAFIVCVMAIFLLAAVVSISKISFRLRNKQWPQSGAAEIFILSLAAAGVLCIFYGFFIEPYWLSIEHLEISSAKIHCTKPIRIVQISDLHCDAKERLEGQLPAVIALQKPDIIVFTGDAINMPEGLPLLRTCLIRLAKIAPTYVVKGNWDADFFTDLDRFGNTGAIELDGKAVKVRVENNDIWIAGLGPRTQKSLASVLKNVPEDAYRIFLFHYPDYIGEMAKEKVDLYLAGHTHGGQVALPFYGALVTMATTGKRYEHGHFRLGDTHLYVNRGIGMEGGKAPRVRFLARPEVTVIDIAGRQN
jgi:uncharacterized protein